MNQIPYRYFLPEDKIPKQWYNLRADMPEQPDAMLHPGTLKPIEAEDLFPIFCEELSHQELNCTDRYIDIPGPVYEYLKMFRPSPLCRAYHLEKVLGTPAKIYYKFEGNNTSGSHKLNSAAAQAYYAKAQGLAKVSTETGAGQWGTAMAMACAYFGVDLRVYMVKGSAAQKPYRKSVIEAYGGNVIPSPSDTTEVGRKILEKFPNTSGSLGCAISEAIEVATQTESCRYVLGSVLNHVMLHQSIIGLEAKEAMEALGEYPDTVIGCAGGGSNLGGIMCAYMGDKLQGKSNTRFIAVEPASCPTLTRGRYAYDFGDTGCTTPLMKMYTLGSGFMPSSDHAGGLRFHGMSPIMSKLYHDGYVDEARAVVQTRVFDAAQTFARAETILPAPESAHAICVAIDEALKCKETGEEKTILFALSGTGYFDLSAYNSYREKTMMDYVPDDNELAEGFKGIPNIPQNSI